MQIQHDLSSVLLCVRLYAIHLQGLQTQERGHHQLMGVAAACSERLYIGTFTLSPISTLVKLRVCRWTLEALMAGAMVSTSSFSRYWPMKGQACWMIYRNKLYFSPSGKAFGTYLHLQWWQKIRGLTHKTDYIQITHREAISAYFRINVPLSTERELHFKSVKSSSSNEAKTYRTVTFKELLMYEKIKKQNIYCVWSAGRIPTKILWWHLTV